MSFDEHFVEKNFLSNYFAQAIQQHKRLGDAHNEHSENAKKLSDELECISDELMAGKKKMDGKASSMTDATPLVEIRAAIQRLRKENTLLDTRIGVLDYELTIARTSNKPDERNSEHSPDESEDDNSFDND
mmetsp:Transcript_25655/g.48886  ORF Transcript_25655/g.48886 Transcript_25655/m.48886 type:complete len:131 (+) Transcript_25655:189-581(+)